MNTEELVDLIGGKEATLKLLNVKLWSLYKLHKSGVPSLHWKKVSKKTGLTMEQVSEVVPSK
jgi:hypothetical protein|tara:strand:- start:1531 stop:1716 length:186 start_codon:yes stop_codon:yes gene_type:complete